MLYYKFYLTNVKTVFLLYHIKNVITRIISNQRILINVHILNNYIVYYMCSYIFNLIYNSKFINQNYVRQILF